MGNHYGEICPSKAFVPLPYHICLDLSQPSNTAVTQGASSNQQQPMRNKPMLPTLVSQNSEDRGFANVPGTPTSLPGGVSRHNAQSAAAPSSTRLVGFGTSSPITTGHQRLPDSDGGLTSVDNILFGASEGSPTRDRDPGAKTSYGTAPKVDYKDFRTIFNGSDPSSLALANGTGSSHGSKSDLNLAESGSNPATNGSSLDSSLWG